MSRRRCAAFVGMLLLSTSLANASIWPKRWRRNPATPGPTTSADPGPNAQTEPGQAINTVAGDKSGVRIKGPSGVVITRGQTLQVTWTVTNTTKPLRVSASNNSPRIAKIKGGDTQIVTSSGGDPNTVTLTITGLRPGQLQIGLVEVDDSARAQELASAFRAALKAIDDKLAVSVRSVPVIPADQLHPTLVRREDVFRLLDNIENDVRNALPQPEFAPFRDAVADLVRKAKDSVDGRFVWPRRASARNGIELVQNESPPAAIEFAKFDAIMRILIGIFRDASERSPVDTLCVRTTPENGASVVLYPASFPSDRHMVRTASRIMLYLGRYGVQINRKEVGFINVLLDQQRVLECSLYADADTQACRLIEGLDKCQ